MTRIRFAAQPLRRPPGVRLTMTAGRYFEIDLSADEAISLIATVSQAVNDLRLARRAPGQGKGEGTPVPPDRIR